MIEPVPHIVQMAAYALADMSAPPGKRLIGLSQNECLRPPSPLVVQAIERAARSAHLYPDPDWTHLRTSIGELHAIDPAQIVCGNGSLDLIGALARAYLAPGLAALAPAHAYPFFRSATLLAGARFDMVPERALSVDVDALLEAITPETRIVFVANPGNPTGTWIPRSDLLRLRSAMPKDSLLVIDEAYGEFADHVAEPMFDLVERGDTIVLRTFSKAYGLAGLRVGWGLFPGPIAGHIRKVLNPNNVALPGQMAAEAALRDQAYMRETCEMTAAIRDRFILRMRAIGLEVPDSFTNFVLMRFPSSEVAQASDQMLRGEGVVLRAQGGAGLPDCLRVTIGKSDDMDIVATLLENSHSQKGSS